MFPPLFVPDPDFFADSRQGIGRRVLLTCVFSCLGIFDYNYFTFLFRFLFVLSIVFGSSCLAIQYIINKQYPLVIDLFFIPDLPELDLTEKIERHVCHCEDVTM